MQIYHTRIIQIGNSKVVRLPKDLALSLGTTKVVLELTDEGILIKAEPEMPPLNKWTAIFAKADTSPEPELNDWDVTLNDGLEDA